MLRDIVARTRFLIRPPKEQPITRPDVSSAATRPGETKPKRLEAPIENLEAAELDWLKIEERKEALGQADWHQSFVLQKAASTIAGIAASSQNQKQWTELASLQTSQLPSLCRKVIQ